MNVAVLLDFAGLYEANADKIRRYFQRHLTVDDMHMAEDLTSATFERAISRADRYVDQGKPASWLFAIAHNILIDYTRRRRATVELPVLDAFRAATDAGAEHHHAALDVERTLGRLNPLQRSVLTERFLHGTDTRGTAELLGRTEDAVKKLQARALVSARHILESPMHVTTIDRSPSPAAMNDTPALQVVTLPTMSESVDWAASTNALRLALEREEREALAAYETAKERLQNARRSANALRQIQGLVKVGGSSTPTRRPAAAPCRGRPAVSITGHREAVVEASRHVSPVWPVDDPARRAGLLPLLLCQAQGRRVHLMTPHQPAAAAPAARAQGPGGGVGLRRGPGFNRPRSLRVAIADSRRYQSLPRRSAGMAPSRASWRSRSCPIFSSSAATDSEIKRSSCTAVILPPTQTVYHVVACVHPKQLV